MNLDLQTAAATLAGVRRLARRFGRDARRHFGPRLKRVTLFGSAARGDWTPESDIDVLVTLDHATAVDVDWLARRALHLGVLGQGEVLQPIVMSERRFLKLSNRERRFALDVAAEGLDL